MSVSRSVRNAGKTDSQTCSTEGIEERRRRANALTFAEASVVGVLCAVLLFACIFYVGQQAKLNQSNTKLASLQKTYASLVEDNNAKSSEIEGSVDYERIYDYAV